MKAIFILPWDLQATALIPGLYYGKKKSLFDKNNFPREALPFEEIFSLAGCSQVNLGNRGKGKANCTKPDLNFKLT